MNLIDEEQLLLKDIFHVRVNPNQAGYAISLRQRVTRHAHGVPQRHPGLRRYTFSQADRVSLLKHSTYFDSLLMERLQLPYIWLHAERPRHCSIWRSAWRGATTNETSPGTSHLRVRTSSTTRPRSSATTCFRLPPTPRSFPSSSSSTQKQKRRQTVVRAPLRNHRTRNETHDPFRAARFRL